MPHAQEGFLGIIAAVLGNGGHNAMYRLMTCVVEKALRVKLMMEKDA